MIIIMKKNKKIKKIEKTARKILVFVLKYTPRK